MHIVDGPSIEGLLSDSDNCVECTHHEEAKRKITDAKRLDPRVGRFCIWH